MCLCLNNSSPSSSSRWHWQVFACQFSAARGGSHVCTIANPTRGQRNFALEVGRAGHFTHIYRAWSPLLKPKKILSGNLDLVENVSALSNAGFLDYVDSHDRNLTRDTGCTAYLAPSGLNGGCLVEVCRQKKFGVEIVKAFRQQFRPDPMVIFRIECQFHELIFKCAIF